MDTGKKNKTRQHQRDKQGDSDKCPVSSLFEDYYIKLAYKSFDNIVNPEDHIVVDRDQRINFLV